MIGFIETHRDRRTEGLKWGVEPICAVLQFAPQTFYAARNRPPSGRAVRDEALKPEIQRVFDENYRVYGAAKVWTQLNREGIVVARCTVERLMANLGICGAVRGRKPTTTRSGGDGTARPPDLWGFLHDVVDDPNSELEASGTLMFAYAAAAATQMGIADRLLLDSALNALDAVAGIVESDGSIGRVSLPPGGPGCQFGKLALAQGFFLLASSELAEVAHLAHPAVEK